MSKIGITKREHVLARRLAGKRAIVPLFAQFGAPANSDYRPLVQLEAPRARYLRATAESLVQLALAPVPILELLVDKTLFTTFKWDTGFITLAFQPAEGTWFIQSTPGALFYVDFLFVIPENISKLVLHFGNGMIVNIQ